MRHPEDARSLRRRRAQPAWRWGRERRSGDTLGGVFEVVAPASAGLARTSSGRESRGARAACDVLPRSGRASARASSRSFAGSSFRRIVYLRRARGFTRPTNRAGGSNRHSPTRRWLPGLLKPISSCARPALVDLTSRKGRPPRALGRDGRPRRGRPRRCYGRACPRLRLRDKFCGDHLSEIVALRAYSGRCGILRRKDSSSYQPVGSARLLLR